MGVVCWNLDHDEVEVIRKVLAGALLAIQEPSGKSVGNVSMTNPDIQTLYALIGDLDRVLGRQLAPRGRVLAPINAPDREVSGPRLLRGAVSGK